MGVRETGLGQNYGMSICQTGLGQKRGWERSRMEYDYRWMLDEEETPGHMMISSFIKYELQAARMKFSTISTSIYSENWA